MSQIIKSTHELFLKLGSTPQSRSQRADQVFRRLRDPAYAEIDKPSMQVRPPMAKRGEKRSSQ